MAIEVVVVHPKMNLGKGRVEVGTKLKLEEKQAKKWIEQGKVKPVKEAKSLDLTKKK